MSLAKKYGRKKSLALDMWVKLARASSTFGRLSAKDIERYGLTQPQFSVLEALGHLGPLPIGDVSRKMLVTGGCMTVIIDNLEKEGLVERIRKPSDRRVTLVQLTPKGSDLFEDIFKQHAEVIADLASVLSQDEQHQLSLLLKKLGLSLQQRHRKKKETS